MRKDEGEGLLDSSEQPAQPTSKTLLFSEDEITALLENLETLNDCTDPIYSLLRRSLAQTTNTADDVRRICRFIGIYETKQPQHKENLNILMTRIIDKVVEDQDLLIAIQSGKKTLDDKLSVQFWNVQEERIWWFLCCLNDMVQTPFIFQSRVLNCLMCCLPSFTIHTCNGNSGNHIDYNCSPWEIAVRKKEDPPCCVKDSWLARCFTPINEKKVSCIKISENKNDMANSITLRMPEAVEQQFAACTLPSIT